eukprot:5140301-Amphidinium_carterae.1
MQRKRKTDHGKTDPALGEAAGILRDKPNKKNKNKKKHKHSSSGGSSESGKSSDHSSSSSATSSESKGKSARGRHRGLMRTHRKHPGKLAARMVTTMKSLVGELGGHSS